MTKLQTAVCLALLAAGLCCAIYSAALRIASDNAYRQLLVAVDWQALSLLAPAAENAPLTAPDGAGEGLELLQELPGAQVCYGEETIGALEARGILRLAASSGAPRYELADPRYESDVFPGALRHGYQVERGAGGRVRIELPGLSREEVSQLPLCWLAGVTDRIRKAGYEVILRPSGSEFLGQDGIKQTLGYCALQRLMLFQGDQVLGYPDDLPAVATQLKGQQQQFGWVEFDEQDGAARLAALMAPAVVRVHSIPPDEAGQYDIPGAVARMVRAARERNIRCLYVRPFTGGAVLGSTAGAGFRARLLTVNREYFKRLAEELKAAGFTFATQIDPPPGPPAWLLPLRAAAVTFATAAAFLFLLALLCPACGSRAYWALLGLSVPAAALAVVMPMAYTVVLLVTALVFPLLGFFGALWLYQHFVQQKSAASPARLLWALIALALASVASALGGLLIHGGMWTTNTMLKVGQFHGVLPALAIPVLLLAAYAWHAESLEDAFERAGARLTGYTTRFMALWTAPIRYGDVAFIMVALGVLGIVLLRSGNESPLETLSVESWFRGSLEQLFSIRPRTKELLGHPLFVVFLLSLPWRNRLSLIFALAALLGQVSILNTFCHLHTPLAMTLIRVALGLGIGIVSGLVWGIVVLIGNWAWTKMRRAA